MNLLLSVLSTWIIVSTSAQLIPASFDARTRWPNCPSIARVPNQGCCNASFTLIPAAVITDRACIRSNGAVTRTYSAYDALTCCTDCPFAQLRKCDGGDPVKVWKYWATTGLVSESCMPFSLSPLCLGFNCPLVCATGSTASVVGDRRKGLVFYQVPSNSLAIQTEIFQNGPVEASFNLTMNFKTYGSSNENSYQNQVYTSKSVSKQNLGNHSVKIIGWGVENGIDYWLAINTYGTGWGINGTVKFLRGVNHLGIESNVRAGIPSV